MKSVWLLAAGPLLGLSFVAGSWAVGQERASSQGLQHIGGSDTSPVNSNAAGPNGASAQTSVAPGLKRISMDTDAWCELLTQGDLDARELGFDQLIQEAFLDPALKDWVADLATGSDGLAWTARLALRELESTKTSLQRHPFGLGTGPHVGLDALFDDPFFSAPFRGLGQGGGAGLLDHHGIDPGTLFRGLVPPDFDPSLDLNSDPFQTGFGLGQISGESVSVQMGPDGVRVEITVQEDATEGNGDKSVQVFEADSMEQLLEEHPELRGKVGTFQGFGTGLGGRHGLFGTPNQAKLGEPVGVLRHDVLGVYLDEIAEVKGQLIALRVAPNSLASRLRVSAGDTLVSMDGRALKSAENLKSALKDRAPVDRIHLRVLSRTGVERDLWWEPEE